MSTPLRYAFIGTGMMGCEHIRNIAALPGAEVVAAADPHESSQRAARKAAGAATELAVYDDPAGLLERDDLDVVVVSTPNHTHREVLEPVWKTDLHIMIEKPLCTTVDDCLEVRDAAASHGGLVWMGLEYRYMPAVSRFIDLVDDGHAGDVRMLAIREHRFPFLAKIGDWNRFTRNTGGTLVEKCCHFFDLMNLVMPGRPVRVLASGGQDVNHLDETYAGEVPDVLDNAFVIVEYEGDRRALLDLCMFAEGSRWEQELVATGDRGKIEAHVPNFMEVSRGSRAELVVGSRGPDWPVEVSEVESDHRVAFEGAHHGASYLEHLHFAEAIRSGMQPAVTVEDGLWSVAVGAAAHRSIDEGRPVLLSEFGLSG